MRALFVAALAGSLALTGCAGTDTARGSQPLPSNASAAQQTSSLAYVHLAHGRLVFDYANGDIRQFIVPDGVKHISVEAAGAEGRSDGSNLPGKGGSVKATLPVRPGESLEIRVGGTGDGSAGGIGIALCNEKRCPGQHDGGAGGGAAYVLHGTAILLVAGGGGGAGAGFYGNGGAGGDGGLDGADGSVGDKNNGPLGGGGGTGGTQSSAGIGGAGGTGTNGLPGEPGLAGGMLFGGNGGDGSWTTGYGGGGGGGGYFGGGGGGGGQSRYLPQNYLPPVPYAGGGGGGGSSYAEPSANNVTFVRGDHTGNGKIVIDW